MAKHILISFVHKVTGAPRRYEFGPSDVAEANFFGLALAKHLATLRRSSGSKTSSQPIDTILFIGTTGSSWDVLVSDLLGTPPAEEGFAELGRAIRNDANKEISDHLKGSVLEYWQERISRRSSERLPGVVVRLVMTPDYAEFGDEQKRLVQLLDPVVDRDCHVTFDVTHSLRHLPILGLTSTMMLHRLRGNARRQARIDEIYYAAPELSHRTASGAAKVIKLRAGLSSIGDWTTALTAFERDGDYLPVADLLELDGFDRIAAELLREAGFLQSVGRLDAAAEKLVETIPALEAAILDGPAALYIEDLRHRLRAVVEATPYQRQRQLAVFALERGDLLRAAMWGFEATVTRFAGEQGLKNQLSRSVRKGLPERMSRELREPSLRQFLALKDIRNHFAHAGQETADLSVVIAALEKRADCHATLRRAFDELIPGQLMSRLSM